MIILIYNWTWNYCDKIANIFLISFVIFNIDYGTIEFNLRTNINIFVDRSSDSN